MEQHELIVLVGPSNSGKSTWAWNNIQDKNSVVSTDDIREVLTGDAGDQSANRSVFEILEIIVRERMLHKQTTVVDATNLDRRGRVDLRATAVGCDAGYREVAFPVAVEVALVRNRKRAADGGLDVPAHIIERHVAKMNNYMETIRAGVDYPVEVISNEECD